MNIKLGIQNLSQRITKALPRIGTVLLVTYALSVTVFAIMQRLEMQSLQGRVQVLEQINASSNQLFITVLEQAWKQGWKDGVRPDPFSTTEEGSCWRVPAFDIAGDDVINKAIRCESTDGVPNWGWEPVSSILDE